MTTTRTTALVSALAFLVSASADGQIVTRRQPESEEHTGPWSTFVGGSLTYAQPQGDFKNYVSGAFGVNGHLVHAFDPAGIIALRAEVGYLIYGQATRRQPLGGGALGLVNVDVTTSNNIVNGGLGLQLMAPTTSIRPYVSGTVGFSYFFTNSSIAGQNNSEPFADSENYGDGGFTTTMGGGLYIPIKLASGRPLSLDFGVQSHANSDIQYLTKEGIKVTSTSAPPVITPVRSSADFVSFRIGVSVGVR
jgi:hypothetical protein